jgi:nucleoside-diphosphate-sugar epimerase
MITPEPRTNMADATNLPPRLTSEEMLDDVMTTPSAALVDDLAAVDGDILVLGVGGKMGPTLARMARRAAPGKRIIAVARFSTPGLRETLEAAGIETIAADLLDRAAVEALPKCRNVVFMAGFKFGAAGDPATTWAMNVLVPAFVADAFKDSRIVAFSTGCVYAFAAVHGGGSRESEVPDPPGDYAQSCLGRERMFDYHSRKHGTPGRLFRLNYAIDLRYGVLPDIATKVRDGTPLDVTMGHVNVIWQGDACAQALRCLKHSTAPTTPINVSGPEILSVRRLAAELGQRLGKTPIITGQEAERSWLTNTSLAQSLFGPPTVGLPTLLDWVADWVAAGRRSLNKPTKFEVRSGAY